MRHRRWSEPFAVAWLLSAAAIAAGCGGQGSAPKDPDPTIAPDQNTGSRPVTNGSPSTSNGSGVQSSSEGQPTVLAPNLEGNQADATGWCGALDVIARNCQGCHASEPLYGAPMSLVSYADLTAQAPSDPSKAVWKNVQSRIHDTQRPMPPSGLNAADLATMDAWIALGAPASADPTCGGIGGSPNVQPPTEFAWPADCEEFYTLTASAREGADTPYQIAGGSEEHPQFFFDAPWGDDEVQILAHRPITDNAAALHHWILYENSGGFGAGGGKFIVGWAPGSQGGGDLPADVGMYAPRGARSLRLDVHYFNRTSAQPVLDASGVELCVTRTPRRYTASVIGLLGDATARPGRSDNTTPCTARVTGGENVTFLSVSPHMHKLGVHAKLTLERSGTIEALHDAPFNFEDQQIYKLDSTQIRSGDVLSTTCSYENDTGQTVRFGQNTSDEMCFNFVTYYPMGALNCGFAR
jgi:hypothetical protein